MHVQAATLNAYKNPQHDSRHKHIQSEKATDAVCEKLLKKQRHLQTMLHYPRDELPVRQNHAQNAE